MNTWLCFTRQITIALFTYSVFGWAALIVAALNLLRPSLVLFAIALAAACFGVVLYNVGLSSLAIGLLVAQPCASRTRARLKASAARTAQTHSDCQLAKVSLNTM